MGLVRAIAGPDKVSPVNRLVGLDGTNSYVEGFPRPMLRYHWRMIQVPEGDPHLITFPTLPGGTVQFELEDLHADDSVGNAAVIGGDPIVIILPGVLGSVVRGDLFRFGSGPNAGTDYEVISVDNVAGTVTLDPAPSVNEVSSDWEIWGTGTTKVDFDFAFGDIEVGDILLANGYVMEAVTVAPGAPGVVKFTPSVPLAGQTVGTLSVIRQTILYQNPAFPGLPIGPYSNFVPTVQGIYIARLTVEQVVWPPPNVFSEPDIVTINVVAANVALDLPIDSKWIWKYLADFWSMVPEKEWTEAMWRSAIRAVGGMIQELWNVEADASLATAQDVTMSRWIGFDTEVKETEPDKTLIVKRPRVVFSNAVNPAVPLVLFAPVQLRVWDNAAGTTFNFTPAVGELPGTFVDRMNAEVAAAGVDGVKFRLERIMPHATPLVPVPVESFHITLRSDVYVADVFQFQLWGMQKRTDWSFPFGFFMFMSTNLTSTTTLELGSDYSGPTAADAWYDTDGVIKPGDPLCIGGSNYTITAVGTKYGTAGYPTTYITFDPPLETFGDPPAVGTPPVFWAIPSYFRSPGVDYGYEMARTGDQLICDVEIAGQRSEVALMVTASSAYRVGTLDPQLFYRGWTVKLSRVRHCFYVPIDDRVLSVPRLKMSPDEQTGWIEYSDFIIADRRDRRCIVFDFMNEPAEGAGDIWRPSPSTPRPVWVYPPERYWGEIVYVDRRPDLEARFGANLGFMMEDMPKRAGFSYQHALLGLWLCKLMGSKPRYIEKGLSIILGAPFFEEDGTILDIHNLDADHGYMLVKDVGDPEIVRSYIYPLSLGLDLNPDTGVVYKVGDTVHQFETLTNAAVYRDYINDPVFIRGLIAAGVITEPQKIHTFHVGVNVDALPPADTSALAAAVRFLEEFRTTYNYPFFSLVKLLITDIDLEEAVSFKVILQLDAYFGQRWGTPTFSRSQLSGSTIHSHFGGILTGDEHVRAELTDNAGTQEIRFYHRNADGTSGGLIDPEKWGIKPNDTFIDESWINGPAGLPDLTELPVLTVTSTLITVSIAGAVAYPRTGVTIDDFVVRSVGATDAGRPWWGFGDLKMYPRDHVRIRLLDNLGVPFYDTDTDPNKPLPGYPGPEQG